MAGPESVLVSACLQYLRVKGVFAWRNNTGAAQVGRRYIRFGSPGSPDIIGVLPGTGRLLGVECKRPGSYARKNQQEFMRRINESGGVAGVVRDLDELEKLTGRGKET